MVEDTQVEMLREKAICRSWEGAKTSVSHKENGESQAVAASKTPESLPQALGVC